MKGKKGRGKDRIGEGSNERRKERKGNVMRREKIGRRGKKRGNIGTDEKGGLRVEEARVEERGGERKTE